MNHFEELSIEAGKLDKLFEACFDWSTSDIELSSQLRSEFFNHYHKQLEQLDLQYGKAGERWIFAEKSHKQISEAISALRDAGITSTRSDARKAIRDHFRLITPKLEDLDPLIDVALRIWLSINFRCPDDISLGGGRPCVSWLEDETLLTTLGSIFQSSSTELTLAQRRLSPAFTVANMVSICGLHVRWATTLDDHLRLDRQQKVLWIFPLRGWLHLHSKDRSLLKASVTQPSLAGQILPPRSPTAPLPGSIYEEAERTMDLLFPSWDKKTQRFLKKQQKEGIATYAQPREFDLKYYDVWRDRLLELNENVFLAPPEGWVQLWNDRRDPQKFWTFWIALVILWLTIISTVAAVLQTWATLRSS